MTSITRPRFLLAVLVVASSVVLGVRSGTASACSCVIGDPVVSIENADVVFTGTLIDKDPVGPDDGYHYDWTFAVDGEVKGEVSSPQFVEGEEFGGGCGVDYSGSSGSITVYARRDGDRLVSIGCSPTPSAAALRAALDAAADESAVVGSGPPAALATGQSVDGNVFVLDSDGLPLARGRLPVAPTAIAHCAGTTRAAVWSYGPPVDQPDGPSVAGTANVVSIIDLEQMEVVATRTIESEFVSIRDQLACLDGGRLVTLSRGDGTDEGPVTVATSSEDGGGASRTFDDVSRAVIHRSGTVALLPKRPGEPIRTIAGPSLAAVGPASGAETGDQIAVVGGAFSPDGDRIAALVTSSGTEVRHDTDATGVMLLDVIDGIVQPAQGDPIPVPPHEGRARQIAWLDDDVLVIEHETDSSKLFAAMSTAGDALASADVGWGWGLTRLDGSILRSRAGGLELIDAAMASMPLVPSPSEQFEDGWFFTAPIVDAPEITLPSLSRSELTIRPFEQPPEEPGGGVVDPIPTEVPTGILDDGRTATESASPGQDRGLQVAGLAFVAFVLVGGFRVLRAARR